MQFGKLYARYYDRLYSKKDYLSESMRIATHLTSCKTILDFGCGTGQYMRHFRALGYITDGYDKFHMMLKHVDKGGHTEIPNLTYDAVTCLFNVAGYLTPDELKLLPTYCMKILVIEYVDLSVLHLYKKFTCRIGTGVLRLGKHYRMHNHIVSNYLLLTLSGMAIEKHSVRGYTVEDMDSIFAPMVRISNYGIGGWNFRAVYAHTV